MMTFLQVFQPVCLEAEAAPAAKELIPHFLILGPTSTVPLQMKPLLGSRSHLRLQKSTRWNRSLLLEQVPSAGQLGAPCCRKPQRALPTAGTLPQALEHRHLSTSPAFPEAADLLR